MAGAVAAERSEKAACPIPGALARGGNRPSGDGWPPRSAYLHIPFCHRRCFYCDFPVVPLGDRASGATGDPGSFDQGRLAGYLRSGVTRVSLGGQSFDDRVLESLGRRHRRSDLLEAAGWLAEAQRHGELVSWSLDLIQGLPGLNLEHWRQQLKQAIALQPPHLSVYDLIIEPGTVFERLDARGALDLPEEDLAADLMELTSATLSGAGYGHYEISNYAKPGHASRHNRAYWSGAGWWGFGLGATSAPWGERLARPRTREGYAAWLEAGGAAPPAEAGSLKGLPLDERVLVGLRRREGVRLEHLAESAGIAPSALDSLRQRWQPFTEQGLLIEDGGRWRLSDPHGLALSNAVLRELLVWWEQLPTGQPPSP